MKPVLRTAVIVPLKARAKYCVVSAILGITLWARNVLLALVDFTPLTRCLVCLVLLAPFPYPHQSIVFRNALQEALLTAHLCVNFVYQAPGVA